ncbi:GIY-YIG nuclease family protein [Shimia sp. MIT1388]|uniref:GIY-YIG nuclease family protein n=1 Tax=Shimia sp. MIT1388 TaxID=3096992 RepID=UPI00399B748A
MERLGNIGFEKVGRWTLTGNLIELDLARLAHAERVLYAFVVNDEVMYIGKTRRTLKKRLYGYQNPGPTQSTNIKNNAKIHEALCDGNLVEIWALVDSAQLRVGEFRIDLAAGLEDDLITKICPPWNGRDSQTASVLVVAPGRDDPSCRKKAHSCNDEAMSKITHDTLIHEFQFLLRKTYYEQGFFNVGVNFEQLIGGDGEQIEIFLGTSDNVLKGRINRSVNSNNTPRIMGGVGLRDWFHRNFEIDMLVSVSVQGKTAIRLSKQS